MLSVIVLFVSLLVFEVFASLLPQLANIARMARDNTAFFILLNVLVLEASFKMSRIFSEIDKPTVRHRSNSV